jgi:4-hydroxybenzoate polyprenyltransferase
LIEKIKKFNRLIMFEHTIFALPYAYLGTFLASYSTTGKLPSLYTLIWVTLAMVGARSAAMALNRLIDRKIDAKNPRTSNRELANKTMSIIEVILFTLGSLLLMAIAAYNLNILCFQLFPVALVILILYPYTKRFTWLCHIVLGIADALAPLGGWIAVTGNFDVPAFVLAGAVAAWIAGFDIIYACQDVEFDKKEGLYSIPARFGVRNALHISTALHIVTLLLFSILPLFAQLGVVYYVGIAIVAILLLIEHLIISPNDMSKIHTAFFTVNSYIALVAFAFTLADILINR